MYLTYPYLSFFAILGYTGSHLHMGQVPVQQISRAGVHLQLILLLLALIHQRCKVFLLAFKRYSTKVFVTIF